MFAPPNYGHLITEPPSADLVYDFRWPYDLQPPYTQTFSMLYNLQCQNSISAVSIPCSVFWWYGCNMILLQPYVSITMISVYRWQIRVDCQLICLDLTAQMMRRKLLKKAALYRLEAKSSNGKCECCSNGNKVSHKPKYSQTGCLS